MFKRIIGKAYGVRSVDGKQFNRTEAQSEVFLGSLAFGELFVQFIEDNEFAVYLVNNLLRRVWSSRSRGLRRMLRRQCRHRTRCRPRSIRRRLSSRHGRLSRPACIGIAHSGHSGAGHPSCPGDPHRSPSR